jgi:hypothetical protein
MSSLKLLNKAQPDGTNFLANVMIPNPTVQTVQMGNLALSLFVPGNSTTGPTAIGNASLKNVTLVPGNNTVPLRSITNDLAVFGLLESNISLLHRMPVDIVVDNSTMGGVVIPYFTRALHASPLHVVLNISAATVE